ncbi:MAG: methyltransferase [Thermoanaerobaculia bacterium]|jgi:(2Fe-2S) ferredoxin/SAM-dependent methyltransferase
MEPFRYHVYACSQQKPEGAPSCPARGSMKTIDALRVELGRQGLMNEVQLTTCGSLGLCERGPNMVVYPDGVWYSSVTPADVPEIVQSHFKNGLAVERLVNRDADALAAEVRLNRDRYLASMKAKEASGALPEELEQSIRAFQESRIILTAIELDVFSAAGEGAGAAAISSRCGTDARATELLLDALVALGLLAKSDGKWRTTPVSKRFLAKGGENDARAALMHQAGLWNRWATLSDCVRFGVPFKPAGARDDAWTRAFIAAMHRNASERAPHVVRAVGTDGVARMLDVGGGSGAYSIAFAQASPRLHAEVLDLEPVLVIANEHVMAAGLSDRVALRAGDLRDDPLGSGFDLIFVSAICHMLDDDENVSLVRRSHEALAPGGRLVIADFILDETRTAPRQAALFSINMLVGTERGRNYTEQEYRSWLTRAGFEASGPVRIPGPAALMIGTKRRP